MSGSLLGNTLEVAASTKEPPLRMQHHMLARIFLLCCFVVLELCSAEAQTDAPTADAADLTLDQIYASPKFDERSVKCKWLPTSGEQPASYLVLESVNQNGAKGKSSDDGDKSDDTGKSIVQYDAATGERNLFLQSSDLIPPGQAKPCLLYTSDAADD